MKLPRIPRPFALASAVTLALCAAPASAQVVFTGAIEPAPLASFCQEETHVLACSGTLLKSSTLDLEKFEGVLTKFTAVERGVECKIFDIIDAVPATSTLVSCGNPVPGCPMRFRVGPSGVIGQWFLFLSFDSAFTPINPVLGTAQIAAPASLLGSGPTFGTGAALDITLPGSIALSGLELHLQGMRQDIGPVGPLELSNSICFTILGPSPPCILPDC